MTKPAAIQALTPKQRDRIIAQMKRHHETIKKVRDDLRQLKEMIDDDHDWADQCASEVEIAIEKMSEYV